MRKVVSTVFIFAITTTFIACSSTEQRSAQDPGASPYTDHGYQENKSQRELIHEGQSGREIASAGQSFEVLFDHNSSMLSEDSKAILDEAGKFAQDNPSQSIELVGHASQVGDQAYNLELSDKRTQTPKSYLQEVWGVSDDRITASALGEEEPTGGSADMDRRTEIFFQ